MKTKLYGLTLAGALIAGVASAQGPASHEDQMKAYVNRLEKDVRGEWQSIVDDAMGLEPGDKAKFWESMTATRGEMTGLWDRRLANIKLYAQNLDKMTDPIAD